MELTRLIGIGVYGHVFKGCWQGKQVAVKQVLIINLNEVRKNGQLALQTLDHQNVVKLLHSEDDTHKNYRLYVMELCQASLDKLFLDASDDKKYWGPMPTPYEVLTQLADGLKYIHENQLTHGKIKPSNVLICKSTDARENSTQVLMKWADFGLCKPVNRGGTCALNENHNSEHWFAPEVISCHFNSEDSQQEYAMASDIFSLGLVFGYFLLNGKHPYGNENTLDNIIYRRPVNLKANKSISGFDLIMRMLDKKLDARPKANQVVEQLGRFQSEIGEKETELLRLCKNYSKKKTGSELKVKRIRKLIRDSININCEDRLTKMTPFILLVRERKNQVPQLVDLIQDFIEHRVAVNQLDDCGRNALHLLFKNYKHDNLDTITQLLISARIDINKIDNDGLTPLCYLIQFNYKHQKLVAVIQLLKDKKVTVNQQIKSFVMEYSGENCEEILKLLELDNDSAAKCANNSTSQVDEPPAKRRTLERLNDQNSS